MPDALDGISVDEKNRPSHSFPCSLADNMSMKQRNVEPEYGSEPELHRIFDMMMERYDRDPNADLRPKIDHVDQFLSLYRLQGCPLWLQYYELNSWQLMRFLLHGSEGAFDLIPLSENPTSSEVTDTMQKMLSALKDDSQVKPDLISEHIKLNAVQVLLANRCLQVGYVCLLRYKAPIQLLIEEAKKGSIDAFLDLIKLDSAFLYSPYGRQILLEAELRNDDVFKGYLVDELEPQPKFWSLKGKRNHYMFLTLYMLDNYAYRNDEAWADFFAAHDIDKYSDVNNVRVQRKRYNLSKPIQD